MAQLVTDISKRIDIISRVANATTISISFWDDSSLTAPTDLTGKSFQLIIQNFHSRATVKTFTPVAVDNTISVKWEEDAPEIQKEVYYRWVLRVTEGGDYAEWLNGVWKFVHEDENSTSTTGINVQVRTGGNTINVQVTPFASDSSLDADIVAALEGADTPSVDNVFVTESAIGDLGGGDMTKAVYDSTDNGRVDNAEQLADGTNTVTAAQARGHIDSTTNPHGVTAAQVGLDAVDNTPDADKPVSTAQQTAIDAVQSNLNTHTGDATIHLNESDVQAIGDVRYERVELSFTALTLGTTTTITVTAGVLRFMRTLDINAATDPTIALSGTPTHGVLRVRNTSGAQRTISLPVGHYTADGKTSPITIEDTERYELNFLTDGDRAVWLWEKINDTAIA